MPVHSKYASVLQRISILADIDSSSNKFHLSFSWRLVSNCYEQPVQSTLPFFQIAASPVKVDVAQINDKFGNVNYALLKRSVGKDTPIERMPFIVLKGIQQCLSFFLWNWWSAEYRLVMPSNIRTARSRDTCSSSTLNSLSFLFLTFFRSSFSLFRSALAVMALILFRSFCAW